MPGGNMKPGFYFVKIEKDGEKTLRFLPGTAHSWPQLLTEFKDFLLGCSFVLPSNSYFDLVEEDQDASNRESND